MQPNLNVFNLSCVDLKEDVSEKRRNIGESPGARMGEEERGKWRVRRVRRPSHEHVRSKTGHVDNVTRSTSCFYRLGTANCSDPIQMAFALECSCERSHVIDQEREC